MVPQTPTVSSSPSGTLTDGDTVTLTCTTASTGLGGSTSYIWNIGGTDGTASASNTLAVNAVDINDVKAYKCKVSGDGSSYSAYSNVHNPTGLFSKMIFSLNMPLFGNLGQFHFSDSNSIRTIHFNT